MFEGYLRKSITWAHLFKCSKKNSKCSYKLDINFEGCNILSFAQYRICVEKSIPQTVAQRKLIQFYG